MLISGEFPLLRQLYCKLLLLDTPVIFFLCFEVCSARRGLPLPWNPGPRSEGPAGPALGRCESRGPRVPRGPEAAAELREPGAGSARV